MLQTPRICPIVWSANTFHQNFGKINYYIISLIKGTAGLQGTQTSPFKGTAHEISSGGRLKGCHTLIMRAKYFLHLTSSISERFSIQIGFL